MCLSADSSLEEVLEEFALFLKGAGYNFDGELNIINEEKNENIDD